MKRLTFGACICCLLSLLACSQKAKQVQIPEYDKGINIIPLPMQLTESDDSFEVDDKTTICVSAEELKPIAKLLADKLRASADLSLQIEIGEEPSGDAIYIGVDTALPLKEEGYTLRSDKRGVSIIGKSAHGAFYGMQTLLQLLPAEVESSNEVLLPMTVPGVEIKDEPAFGYRGFMLDVCRHFLSVEDIKKHIDIMAMFKINRFHWHLTEDQAWRIEIKKYPRLTEVGSTRTEGDGTQYSGFYTQEQVRDIVQYASDRFITVIPEIEMPGHAMAALAAYPQLACFPREFKPRIIWGVEQDVYCAGKDSVFRFISDVIDEVAPLFPGTYFHIGGDECPKDRWKACSLCQKRMRDNGLKDEHELQSYFIKQAEKVLQKHGKRLIGWDEILEGGLAPSATVMSWRGEDGGIAAANMNHDVIMTPGSGGLYLDHYQGDPTVEPVAIGGYAPLEQVYAYNPLPKELPADKHRYVLGAQANLWAEYLYTSERYDYQAYPRLLAVAELTWTPLAKKDFADFCRRLDNACVRLDMHGINYHIPLPEQPGGSSDFIAFTDKAKLTFTTSRPMKMVYTLDETEPTLTSTPYTVPLEFAQTGLLKIRTVTAGGKMSPVRRIRVEKQPFNMSMEVPAPKPGLTIRTAYGDLYDVPDLQQVASWEVGTVSSLEEIMHGKEKITSPEVLERRVVEATGYVLIPEDGVYEFSTENNEFWIDNVKLIDNVGEVKKFSRRNSSRALQKGYHPIKTIWVGAIQGGWPTYWNYSRVMIRLKGEEKFKPISSDMLFQ